MSRRLVSPPDGRILVNYSMGDDVCGSHRPAKTIIQLKCGSTLGRPKLLRWVWWLFCHFLIYKYRHDRKRWENAFWKLYKPQSASSLWICQLWLSWKCMYKICKWNTLALFYVYVLERIKQRVSFGWSGRRVPLVLWSKWRWRWSTEPSKYTIQEPRSAWVLCIIGVSLSQ